MSEIKQKFEVTQYKDEVIGYKCDICEVVNQGIRLPKDWCTMNHHHDEWGNDSFESLEDFHICSVECFTKQLEKSIIKMGDYKTAMINDMQIEFAKKLYKKLISPHC